MKCPKSLTWSTQDPGLFVFTKVRVQWLNERHEQFDFYDIAVQFRDGRQEFYEVKSTVTCDKRLLEAQEAAMENSVGQEKEGWNC